jgi:hypothetical protein
VQGSEGGGGVRERPDRSERVGVLRLKRERREGREGGGGADGLLLFDARDVSRLFGLLRLGLK